MLFKNHVSFAVRKRRFSYSIPSDATGTTLTAFAARHVSSCSFFSSSSSSYTTTTNYNSKSTKQRQATIPATQLLHDNISRPPDGFHPSLLVSKAFPTHIIFGANTDVGKTVISTLLVKHNVSQHQPVHYIKPLQCGGSDEGFVRRHLESHHDHLDHHADASRKVAADVGLHTLFEWQTPASPHLASRLEDKPVSDDTVLSSLLGKLADITTNTHENSSRRTATPMNGETNPSASLSSNIATRIWIETAGGVLSPSASSPNNTLPRHARNRKNHVLHEEIEKTNSTCNWGWSTQADLYSSLHLPALLVGDGRLGGISATLSALESLIVRGYDVHAIVLIDDAASATSSNVDALQEYASRMFKLRSGSGRQLFQHPDSIVALPPLPPLEIPLHEYLDSSIVREKVGRLEMCLKQKWDDHVDILWELREEGRKQLWWPFTQHQGHAEKKAHATVIDGAKGDYFSIVEHRPVSTGTGVIPQDGSHREMVRTAHFDACASWWTQGIGHGETTLSLAASAAAGKFGHVIFPDVVHEPARALADRLLNSKSGPGKGWASRVFFTDDGSTAMEVAIKMGMKKFVHDLESRGNGEKLEEGVKLTVCAQQDCYHGDTLGVMDVAEPSVFNKGQHPWYEPKGLFLQYPTIRYVEGSIGIAPPSACPASGAIMFENIEDILDMNKRLSSDLYQHYCKTISKEWDAYESNTEYKRLIGSVIIEPVLLGAGGMKFIDPLWQRALMDIARAKSVPIIFDEVAAGLYRLGVSSCREILGANPDIAAYAKLLTGGIVPMSVTLATENVFRAFLGDTKAEALLHGHSYTAHAVGCVSSIHALDTFADLLENDDSETGTARSKNIVNAYFDQKDVAELSLLPFVQDAMSLGTVIAVTMEPDTKGSGYAATGKSIPIVQDLLKNGVYARPLGNVVYIMVSPLTRKEECSRLCGLLKESILSL